nr:hypothetical protein CFP56_75507 [Quercus suber]
MQQKDQIGSNKSEISNRQGSFELSSARSYLQTRLPSVVDHPERKLVSASHHNCSIVVSNNNPKAHSVGQCPVHLKMMRCGGFHFNGTELVPVDSSLLSIEHFYYIHIAVKNGFRFSVSSVCNTFLTTSMNSMCRPNKSFFNNPDSN